MKETYGCPACGKVLPKKGVPRHTNHCSLWWEKFSIPTSEFNFEKFYRRGLYSFSLKVKPK